MTWALAVVAGVYSVSMMYLLYEVGVADREYEEREMKYRTKPVEIDAMQWRGLKHEREFFAWLRAHADDSDWIARGDELFFCEESGAWISVKPGMYVIRQHVRGRFTACERGNFEYQHELVKEDQ
jgi:hypothetical protein